MHAKVYSYRRFSDPSQQKGASVARQDAFAQAWAAKHGIELDDKLSMLDEGLSAYHQRHVSKGALGVFLRAIEADRIARGSILIVESLDRLSRAEVLDALAQLTLIINAGITVVTASDDRTYSRDSLKANPMDLMQSLLIMWRAHEESSTKSKRVRDAIRRQAQGWIAGTYRGLVRVGQTPSWLRVVDGKWELIPDRADAIRQAVALFGQGLGAARIVRSLHETGVYIGQRNGGHSGHLLRVLAHPAIVGEKHIDLEGETYVLKDYYPALLTQAEWDSVRHLHATRSRKYAKVEIPQILTGTSITFCGYCGAAMRGQFFMTRRSADGRLLDSYRRLQCIRINQSVPCSVAGSCSSGPIERALLNFCSDMVNLQSLYDGDLSVVPRAELASAVARVKELDRQLQRLTDAMLESDGPVPATFASRARDLERDRETAVAAVDEAERRLAAVVRTDLTGADEKWRALVHDVEAMDTDARHKARLLIADTFARIQIYHHGLDPDGSRKARPVISLLAKGGTSARAFQIDADGRLEQMDVFSGVAAAA